MEICRRPKEVWNRSETVWNCRKAAISADPTFVWKFVDVPKRSETGLKPSETVGKQLYPLILHLYGNLWTSQRGLKQVWNRRKAAISADPTFVWKFMDILKRSEKGLKPSETKGKQLYPLWLRLLVFDLLLWIIFCFFGKGRQKHFLWGGWESHGNFRLPVELSLQQERWQKWDRNFWKFDSVS